MIYTAITNQFDIPRNSIKCFTEYNKFKSPVLNAKIYKILSHLFIDDEYSIWIDGNLFLKVEEKELIKLLGDKDIAVFQNPYRDNIYEEADECKRLKLDDNKIIDEQIKRYGNSVEGLGACYLIIRRNTKEIKRLNEKWWAEICRGSVRDQISFPYVFRDNVKYLPKRNPFDNKFFSRIGHL